MKKKLTKKKKFNKPAIEIKLNYWNKRTDKDKDRNILWLLSILSDMQRGVNFSDDFKGTSY